MIPYASGFFYLLTQFKAQTHCAYGTKMCCSNNKIEQKSEVLFNLLNNYRQIITCMWIELVTVWSGSPLTYPVINSKIPLDKKKSICRV